MDIPKIMIVDDNVVSVMELEEALSAHGYQVVGVAGTGIEAVKLAPELAPDLILMDIKMPGGMDGISAAEKIIQHIDIPIIFFTGHDDEELLERASRLNPAGYLLKPFVGRQIIAAIEIALRSAEESGTGMGKLQGESEGQSFPKILLTPAESRIANLIKEGKSSKEIAKLLKVNRKTVDWHRTNIRKKFKLNDKENLFSYLQNT